MRGFVPVPGGWASELDSSERRIIARVVADTAELLGERLEAEPEQSGDADSTEDGDAAVLASLDWDTTDDAEPTDAALARLLPPASLEDEETAGELRRLMQGSLRATKIDHLRRVYGTLVASSGVVLVTEGNESAWLAALTDMRLVLANRLGIASSEDAEQVYERAGSPTPASDDDVDAALTSLYGALTWWQDSLLQAMSQGDEQQ